MIARFSSLADCPAGLKGAVVAIGNFDGVHRGHQVVLARALDLARAAGRPALVLTFEPHPRTVFRPDNPVFRLTPAALKAELLGAMGFAGVMEQGFDHAFAARSAGEFVREILKDGLEAHAVVTGFDFHFGKGREGGPAYLMEAGKREGFGVTLVDAVRSDDANVISSSRIRAALEGGHPDRAAALLGHHYRVRAVVQKGKQLGRTLGYPTANMALPPETALAHGIYAVRYRRADGSLHDGVASFGRRPTVDSDGEPLLETVLFDFSGDLYGEAGTVTLFRWLRGEEKFDGLDPLVAQMKRDAAQARQCLADAQPLSALDAQLNFPA